MNLYIVICSSRPDTTGMRYFLVVLSNTTIKLLVIVWTHAPFCGEIPCSKLLFDYFVIRSSTSKLGDKLPCTISCTSKTKFSVYQAFSTQYRFARPKTTNKTICTDFFYIVVIVHSIMQVYTQNIASHWLNNPSNSTF